MNPMVSLTPGKEEGYACGMEIFLVGESTSCWRYVFFRGEKWWVPPLLPTFLRIGEGNLLETA
jgi:hypothetical protein